MIFAAGIKSDDDQVRIQQIEGWIKKVTHQIDEADRFCFIQKLRYSFS